MCFDCSSMQKSVLVNDSNGVLEFNLSYQLYDQLDQLSFQAGLAGFAGFYSRVLNIEENCHAAILSL